MASAFFLLCNTTGYGQQQTRFDYDAHWKKVENFQKRQMPESALLETESILNEAQRQGNFQETVKAFVHRMGFIRQKDYDATDRLLKEFEQLAQGDFRPEDQALLHSMLAELYVMRYQDEQYDIDRRTPVTGLVPDSISLWSRNHFYDKINAELDLSLNQPELLKTIGLDTYETLLEKPLQTATAPCRPTDLYTFLLQRAVMLQKSLQPTASLPLPLNEPALFAPSDEFIRQSGQTATTIESRIVNLYRLWEQTASEQGDSIAQIFVSLERLNYLREHSEHPDRDTRYMEALRAMKKRYDGQACVVEIMATLAEYMLEDPSYARHYPNHKRQAYELCVEGIARYPHYDRINRLKNIQAEIMSQDIQVSLPAVVKPHSPLTFSITSRNITSLQVKIFQVNATAEQYHIYRLNHTRQDQAYPHRKQVLHTTLATTADSLFMPVNDTLTVHIDNYGIYEYEVYEKGHKKEGLLARGSFVVTDFALIQRRKDGQNNVLYTLDRQSGARIPQVEIKQYKQVWDKKAYILQAVDTLVSDPEGHCIYDTQNTHTILVLQKGDDRYFSTSVYQHYYRPSTQTEDDLALSLFCDRSLYRPGQTVYFKGIAYRPKSQKTVNDSDFEVKLLDANRKEIKRQTFRSNEFGSFSGTFLLPENGLGGVYYIESDHGTLTFRVEEYKRPTFEVVMDTLQQETAFGSPIAFSGHVRSYAGYDVAGAQITYKIVRHPHRWWSYWNEPARTVANGTLTAGPDGRFTVTFTPERIAGNATFLREQYYIYELEAVATDNRGETQSASQSIAVGERLLLLNLSLPATVEKSRPAEVRIHAETLNGASIDTEVHYSLQRLAAAGEYREKLAADYPWKVEAEVQTGTFNTRDRVLPLDLTTCTPGNYRLVATTTDSRGHEVTAQTDFVLYDRLADQTPVKTYLWLTEEQTVCTPGEQAEIRFGTSADSVQVLYEIMRGNEVLESRWLILNDEVRAFHIPYQATYGDAVVVQFTFIKDEQVFNRMVPLRRRVEERRLTPTWNVFRDKLRPGEKAEWTLTLPETADGRRTAEVMAAMYDASLDAIWPHRWAFNPTPNISIPYPPSWNAAGMDNSFASGYYRIPFKSINDLCYRALDWFGYDGEVLIGATRFNGLKRIFGYTNKKTVSAAPPIAMDMAISEDAVLEEETVTQAITGSVAGSDNTPQVRQNFNETAFFYPHLQTDHAGNVQIAFTVPESLTRWQVNVLAHTPDLYYGQTETQVVTQQEVMVRPHLPRFVRRSDRWVLTADVVNLTDSTLQATASLQLIDPATGKPIRLADGASRSLTLNGGTTRTASWTVTEQTAYDLLIVRLTVHAGTFTDGEQSYLPVLPDQILLTESLPLTVHGGEKRTFRFDRLMENTGLRSQNLTVEMTAHPVWQAILALPDLTEPAGDNVIDHYTAYYASVLAAHIVNSYPKIADTFQRWSRTEGGKDALLSNLEKNSELKNVLLEETPWVLEAADETEQRRRIALLFDLNMQKDRTDQYLAQLKALQNADGGFPWYKGMGSNRYVTQTILLGLARLSRMTGTEFTRESWVLRALDYADRETSREYETLKRSGSFKDTQQMHINNLQWHYLHLRSLYPAAPVSAEVAKACAFYKKQAFKHWHEATLYGKAATALIARTDGKPQLADDIIVSLRELALHHPDMGMYWNNRQDAHYWDARPVFIQTALIEAFAEAGSTPEELDEMKLWLLRQKQTQRWDSPVSAADAIYALLHYGTDLTSDEGKVTVQLGKHTLKPDKQEAGSGYFKTSLAPADITSRTGRITVSNTGKGTAWGAVYWQYWQDIDQVQKGGQGLQVNKQLFVERVENGTKTMYPIGTTNVRRGDRIITRIEISTDRHLEYVALKDLRAACLEPAEQLSGYEWKEGTGYYRTSKDNATHFFFDYLPKGSYVFEYESWASHTGQFASGIATVQCLYAPEFSSHSASESITVTD